MPNMTRKTIRPAFYRKGVAFARDLMLPADFGWQIQIDAADEPHQVLPWGTALRLITAAAVLCWIVVLAGGYLTVKLLAS